MQHELMRCIRTENKRVVISPIDSRINPETVIQENLRNLKRPFTSVKRVAGQRPPEPLSRSRASGWAPGVYQLKRGPGGLRLHAVCPQIGC